MNISMNKFLKKFDVHLASGSPRRKLILQQMGMDFTVTPSTFEENLDKASFEHPKDYVLETGRQKGEEVFKRLKQQDPSRSRFVISADTVVVSDNKILEKPKDNKNAEEMLTRLNEIKSHQVFTGVTLLKYDGETLSTHQFAECSDVEFGDIPIDVIKEYASTVEPLDKAGATIKLFWVQKGDVTDGKMKPTKQIFEYPSLLLRKFKE